MLGSEKDENDANRGSYTLLNAGNGTHDELHSGRGSNRESAFSGGSRGGFDVDEDLADDSGCSFVETDRFNTAIGNVIFVNILVMWGETDAPEWHALWNLCENIFLLIFIAELGLRICHFKEVFFKGEDKWWGYLDVSLVVLGIIDLWLAPVIVRIGSGGAVSAARKSRKPVVLQILRLLRLLRLLRVFKMFEEMKRFAKALMGMGSNFVWIFVVLALCISSTAIVLTHFLGHGEALGDHESLDKEWAVEFESINYHFGDVWSSAFTLFQITTADNWNDVGVPIISIDHRWRAFFYLFIGFASWTMISVLTAVASNSMFEATADQREAAAAEIENNKKRFCNFLKDAFMEVDIDGTGVLDKEEFFALIQKDFVHEEMERLGLVLSQDDLANSWMILDWEDSGEITIDEFIDGLVALQEVLDTRHIVNIDYNLKRVHCRVEARMAKCKDEMDELVEQSMQVLERINAQSATQHEQQTSFWLWQQWAQKTNAWQKLQGQGKLIKKGSSAASRSFTG